MHKFNLIMTAIVFVFGMTMAGVFAGQKDYNALSICIAIVIVVSISFIIELKGGNDER